jgi:hypothetical protein
VSGACRTAERRKKIPSRFRPKIIPPSWYFGDHHYFKQIRNEYRRLAHYQIDELIKFKVTALEQESAEIELQILSHGFVTDAAKEFFGRLPTVAALIPPIKIDEISALLDGRSLPSTFSGLSLPAF